MTWDLHQILVIIQRCVSGIGIFIIFTGVLFGLYQYICYVLSHGLSDQSPKINVIRLNLGRILILGLEFIVAGDLIGTTTAPDYYTVGMLAIIVAIRTVLSFSINREIASLSKR